MQTVCEKNRENVGDYYPVLKLQVMHNVIQSKCACMDSDVTDPNDDEGSLDEAEQDEVLFEYAGDILPSLGQALSDPEKFKTYFAGMLTHLVKKTKPRYATKFKLIEQRIFQQCAHTCNLQAIFLVKSQRAILRSILRSIYLTIFFLIFS